MNPKRVSAALATCLWWATSLGAQPTALNQLASENLSVQAKRVAGELFVPGSFVPLSQFERKVPAGVAELRVHPEVLEWIRSQPGGEIQVMVKSPEGDLSLHPVTGAALDSVKLHGTIEGDCVAVSALLTHVIDADENHSVQTHWDDAGQGRQSFGATDGRTTLSYDPLTGESRSGSIQSNDGNSPYVYDVAGHNLFSDGSGDPLVEQADTPDFERYIGESYTTAAPTNLRAIWLSEQVRAATGWPLAHRNAGQAGAELHEVQSELPLFQAVHAHLVDIGDLYPQIPGSENSLASFFLPPFWKSDAEPRSYPVLLNGSYDLHGLTFGEHGVSFMSAQAELYAESGGAWKAIGVLWNGGGAAVSITQQPSAYDNAAKLIADVASMLHGDELNLVLVGSSRSGTAALTIASNPTRAPYRTAYVASENPHVKVGEVMRRYVNPGYGLIQRSMEGITGYRNAWRKDFVVPEGEPMAGLDATDLASYVTYGTTDPVVIDEEYSVNSRRFRMGLSLANPMVILSLGTHDYSRPFAQGAEYVNKLAGTRLSVLCNVLYRFGHVRSGVTPEPAELLRRVFMEREGKEPAPMTATPMDVELAFYGSDPDDPQTPVRIHPPHVPGVLEMPILVGEQQDFTMVVIGSPGATVEVYRATMEANWRPGRECCSTSGCCSDLSSSCLGLPDYPSCFASAPVRMLNLPTLSDGPVFGTYVLDVNAATAQLPVGYSWYELFYDLEGGIQPQMGEGDLALEGSLASGLPPGVSQNFDPCAGELGAIGLIRKFDQPLIRVLDCASEVFAASELTRMGGLAGDRLHLPAAGQ